MHAVFVFADLFSFTRITEALQEDVLSFVNEIARIGECWYSVLNAPMA